MYKIVISLILNALLKSHLIGKIVHHILILYHLSFSRSCNGNDCFNSLREVAEVSLQNLFILIPSILLLAIIL